MDAVHEGWTPGPSAGWRVDLDGQMKYTHRGLSWTRVELLLALSILPAEASTEVFIAYIAGT